jgi:uncharacterized SAM-binding protein YcdF (DUF218 family)
LLYLLLDLARIIIYDARSFFVECLFMSWLITNLISTCMLPPLNLLLLGAAGLLLWHRRPAIARGLVTVSLCLLWLLSTPYVSNSLMRWLEGEPAALDVKAQPADAIVVLGGGSYFDAPEYGGDTVSDFSLVRVRYAARLQHETGKPVLVSGGAPQGNASSEAAQMQTVLENEFHVPVKWAETASNNTFENASFSRKLLEPAGIRRIYLVTHAWHMPRAVAAFRAAGFDVVPAPTYYSRPSRNILPDLMPKPEALHDSRHVMHELIGMLWYRLKSAN